MGGRGILHPALPERGQQSTKLKPTKRDGTENDGKGKTGE